MAVTDFFLTFAFIFIGRFAWFWAFILSIMGICNQHNMNICVFWAYIFILVLAIFDGLVAQKNVTIVVVSIYVI